MFLMTDPTRRRSVLMFEGVMRKHLHAAPPVLLVLLTEELSTSNSSSFVGRL